MNWASTRVNARPGKSRVMVVAIKDLMVVMAVESMVVEALETSEAEAIMVVAISVVVAEAILVVTISVVVAEAILVGAVLEISSPLNAEETNSRVLYLQSTLVILLTYSREPDV